MATGRSSPSSISCGRASSTAHGQTSFVGDMELVSLVPTVDNPIFEQSQQSSTIDLSGTRCNASHPTKIRTTSYHEDKSSARTRPPFLQSGKLSKARRLLLDSWLCEYVAICFSIACLVAIALVVAEFDDEKIPLKQLSSGLMLNAIISVLSTASRASLIFVVSATMGQLKWCWLKRSGRQIHDIQAMDDASRGPLGAFGVLVFWTGGSLAALGSSVMTLYWQAEDGELNPIIVDKESYDMDRSKRAFCPVEDYAFGIQRSLRGQYDTSFSKTVYDRYDNDPLVEDNGWVDADRNRPGTSVRE